MLLIDVKGIWRETRSLVIASRQHRQDAAREREAFKAKLQVTWGGKFTTSKCIFVMDISIPGVLSALLKLCRRHLCQKSHLSPVISNTNIHHFLSNLTVSNLGTCLFQGSPCGFKCSLLIHLRGLLPHPPITSFFSINNAFLTDVQKIYPGCLEGVLNVSSVGHHGNVFKGFFPPGFLFIFTKLLWWIIIVQLSTEEEQVQGR